jgi:transketolase
MENNNKKIINYLNGLALDIRRRIINIAHNVKGEGIHLGGALSSVEILSVLYGYIMNFNPDNPTDDNRDRFILSKGHDCLVQYATLNAIGCITDDEIKDNYLTNGGFLPTHTIKNLPKGIECSSGSLGMGLSFAVGKALVAKLDKKSIKYSLCWVMGNAMKEVLGAMMVAQQYKLSNLIMIIDRNQLQSDGATKEIMDVNLFAGISAMGWKVVEADGHNIEAIITSLNELILENNNLPVAIIANTIKGKGISFMENNNMWHHGRLSEEQYKMAMDELQIL